MISIFGSIDLQTNVIKLKDAYLYIIFDVNIFDSTIVYYFKGKVLSYKVFLERKNAE